MSITTRPLSLRRTAWLSRAGAIAAVALAAPLAAQELPCVTVNYRDLNLATPPGAATLYRRISGAARSVCGERGYGLFFERQWDQCYRAAVAGAVATVNSPLLSDLHRHEGRGPNVTALAIW
jgi:UrcA family protein